MKIKLRSNGISESRAKKLLDVAQFFLHTMLTEEEMNKINIFRFILDTSVETHGEYGYQTDLPALPGHYTIAIAKESAINDAIEHLAHEFIHLKQSLSGRLTLIPTGVKTGECEWVWEGVSYGVDPYATHEGRDAHYDHLPWETEAYDSQARWASWWHSEGDAWSQETGGTMTNGTE